MKNILLALLLIWSGFAHADGLIVPPLSLPLSAANGGTGNTGGAFTVYGLTASCGQITGSAICTGTGRFQQTGKRVDLSVLVSVSGTFTGGTFNTASLPSGLPANSTSTVFWQLVGQEVGITGIQWVGEIRPNGTTFSGETGANSNTILAGYTLSFSGWYETQ